MIGGHPSPSRQDVPETLERPITRLKETAALNDMAMHGVAPSVAEATHISKLRTQSGEAGGHPFYSLARNVPSR
jgi:hypothetical protein